MRVYSDFNVGEFYGDGIGKYASKKYPIRYPDGHIEYREIGNGLDYGPYIIIRGNNTKKSEIAAVEECFDQKGNKYFKVLSTKNDIMPNIKNLKVDDSKMWYSCTLTHHTLKIVGEDEARKYIGKPGSVVNAKINANGEASYEISTSVEEDVKYDPNFRKIEDDKFYIRMVRLSRSMKQNSPADFSGEWCSEFIDYFKGSLNPFDKKPMTKGQRADFISFCSAMIKREFQSDVNKNEKIKEEKLGAALRAVQQ